MKRGDIDDVHVIELAARFHRAQLFGLYRVPAVTDALVEEGVPPKVARAKVLHLTDRGLLDYGVSARTAWPTPEGLALLRAVGET